MEPIQIIVAGGTLDKKYNPLSGELVFGEGHLPEMLSMARSALPVEISSPFLKDSLVMDDGDRSNLAGQCNACVSRKIVITHGTDTMTDSAKVLAENVKGKTIVLTGAMVPFSFVHSDALFNLGAALAAVQLLPEGVYISMHGRVFPWNRVKKFREAGEFRDI